MVVQFGYVRRVRACFQGARGGLKRRARLQGGATGLGLTDGLSAEIDGQRTATAYFETVTVTFFEVVCAP